MKNLSILIVLCGVLSCKSVSKEEYLSNACECITEIDSASQDLKAQVADCLQSNFVAYRSGAERTVNAYLSEHPNATKEEAQNYIVENLHQQMLTTCPPYNDLQKSLEEKNLQQQ